MLYFPIIFLLCHLVGDFIFQSDWMAMNKSKKTWNCLVHCIIYTSCFLVLTLSWKALIFIGVTHFIFDRFPIIIKRLIWLKNHINPTFTFVPFDKCSITGYYDNILNEATGKPYTNEIKWLFSSIKLCNYLVVYCYR